MKQFCQRLHRRTNRSLASQQGYSIIELIVSATIFVLVSIVAIAVFVSVSNSSTKTAAQRKVQQDVRVNIEELARTVRSSRIDYDFYEKSVGDARCELDTSSAGGYTGSRALALFATQGDDAGNPVTKRVIFYYDPGSGANTGALYRYEASDKSATPTCTTVVTGGTAVRLTADNVVVIDDATNRKRTRFFVSPVTDPYGAKCASILDLACQRPRNTHPRVTMVVTVRTQRTPTALKYQNEFSQTTIQTTVNSRAYPTSATVGQPT